MADEDKKIEEGQEPAPDQVELVIEDDAGERD